MNKTIWTYWHQGFDKAPIVVQKCVEQMQRLNPDWEIKLLDKDTVYDYATKVSVKKETWDKLSIQHRSDLLRTQLLIKHGGVWMDPTVFCVRPLNDWLLKNMVAGFFFFHRPGKDRIISNWFIAAEKDRFFLKKLYDELIRYWNKYDFKNLGRNREDGTVLEFWIRRIIGGRSLLLSQVWLTPVFTRILKLYPYMIYHYMVYNLIRTDKQCRDMFKNMPKISANGPHRLQELGLLNDMTQEAKEIIHNGTIPLFKLKWNLKTDQISESSILHELFQQ